ncbi:hypothetical protein OHA72_45825 [Dactylosporangium sp. NBC_01737]|uniref:hypothetical protein n=1 Tax=Dactylosporangium sp. NBC_01737 TaxID=2975959 RepID=UPI002E1375FF|nr:hypothetical protein OHA72_45825 [Dactylosporangium sp. NBC_01737]
MSKTADDVAGVACDADAMSFNGCVLCDCLDTGVSTPPPCPIVFHGPWVAPAPGYQAQQRDVDTWAQAACAHPGLQLVDDQISRGQLRETLAGFGGAATFPALHAAILDPVDDQVPPDDSARCLAELDHLAVLTRADRMVVLIDADDGTVLHVRSTDRLVSFPRIHAMTPPYAVNVDAAHRIHGMTGLPDVPLTTVWLDEDAIVRVRDADGVELFAAREFRQEAAGHGWQFRNDITGAEVLHSSPVPWSGVDRPRPARLRAEDRPMDIDIYISSVALLRELFTTSMRVKRPVWLY